jgi:hypothetical protein
MDKNYDIVAEALEAAGRQHGPELRVFESGATKCHPSDQYPYTIIGMINDVKREVTRYIIVQSDRILHVSGNFQSTNAVFAYERNSEGQVVILKQCTDGRWRDILDSKGPYFALGSRKYYQSPEI